MHPHYEQLHRILERCLNKYGIWWADYDSWGSVMAIHPAPIYDGAEPLARVALIARVAEHPSTFTRAGHAYAKRAHEVGTDGAHPSNGLVIDLGPAAGNDMQDVAKHVRNYRAHLRMMRG